VDQLTERANRALFEGDRTKVLELLSPRIDGKTNVRPSIQDFWLYASALEDEEMKPSSATTKGKAKNVPDRDDLRTKLLEVVRKSGQKPYADLGSASLEREAADNAELNRLPRWQQFMIQRRGLLLRLIAVFGTLSMCALIFSLLNPPPDPALVASGATATAVARTPTVTPTVTLLPQDLTTPVAYPPFGTLEILSVEYPTVRPVVRGDEVQTPPVNSDFMAIQYEFYCGRGISAFCSAPPEAQVSLELDSGQIVDDPGLTIRDPALPPPGSVPSGNGVRGWIAYPVPRGQFPVALIIQPRTAPGEEVETYRLEIPR